VRKQRGTMQRRKRRRRAVVLANHDGKIQFVDPAGTRWLKEFFGRARKSRTLPRKVYRWLTKQNGTKHAASLVAKRRDTQLHLKRQDSFTEHSIVLLLELVKGKTNERSRRHRTLTAREREVLFWVAQGKSNSEIGAILGIVAATVGKHLERIYPKLGVENRTAAASFAFEHSADLSYSK
jgi:DNA-binding CsgD family transcriptional regulator